MFNPLKTNEPNQTTNQRSNWGRRLARKHKSTSPGLCGHSCVSLIAGLSYRHQKL